MKLLLALLAASVMLFAPLYAADIYRWVDENGRTQFSDVVPEKYRKSAKKVDSRQNEPSEQQRKEAEARAEQDKLRAEEAAQRKARADANATAKPAATPKNSPQPVPDKSSDCETLRRLYKESLDCFAPYITATGNTKAEAFEKCTAVADPSPKCGPAK